MVYIPTFLTTVSSQGSNALRAQAKDVYHEFASGNAGAMEAGSFADMLGSVGGSAAMASSARNASSSASAKLSAPADTPLDAQLDKFRAFNLAYDETIGPSATGYLKAEGGYDCEDGGTVSTAAATEFNGLFEQTMQQQGFQLGSSYQLTGDSEGNLVVQGTPDDKAINAFLKTQPDIEQSYARVTAGFTMAQEGQDTAITNQAWMKAALTGNNARMTQVLNDIIAHNFKQVSLSVKNGTVTPLFDGSTSAQRLAMLRAAFPA